MNIINILQGFGKSILPGLIMLSLVVGQSAIVILQPTEGSSVQGIVRFSQAAHGIRVTGTISGLTAGPHGFHIHEYGDCTDPAGKSAGGHFNPAGAPHGDRGQPANKRHVGDLGNIVADKKGIAQIDFIDPLLSFSGDNNIIGRAVVVHAGRDDLTSQPSGAAGPRLACGVIGRAKQ
ncbi:MAG: superoxide dismutase family protein [Fidelibacterota bacterium]